MQFSDSASLFVSFALLEIAETHKNPPATPDSQLLSTGRTARKRSVLLDI